MAQKPQKKDSTVFDELINQPPKLTVLSDNPVSLADIKSDIFNFRYHLGPIYDIIRHEKTQMPLTIGINGKWGTGKTTAMQWLFDALEKWKQSDESKGKVKTRNVWFYPWKYHKKEDVWKGLIAEVILNVTDFENASTATVLKSLKLLSAFAGESVLDILSDTEFEVAGFKVKPGVIKKIKKNFQKANHPEKPYLNEYEDAFKDWIKDALSRNNERMVIFIDDLDRCMPDIALQVLEALKLYLKIDKLIFVIGMDMGVVKEAVKAYYKNKHIEDIDAGCYLDKMLQVELQLSPLKKEMDIYLDEQLQTVGYERNLEDEDNEGNKKFYTLFRDLISKYGERNPRKVKRLINSSLIRGAGAERIEKKGDNDKLTFEQGLQVFFIQYILAKEFLRPELVGDGGIGDQFFYAWSCIVRKYNGTEGFTRTVTLPEKYHQRLEQAEAELGKEGSESMRNRMSLEKPKDVHEVYYGLIKYIYDNKLPVTLLANKDLGDLLQIEYSEAIAGVSKQQDSDLLKTNDAVIIRNAIAEELKKEPGDLTDKDYDSVTKLSLSGKKITDITFLKQCKNLKQLYLNNTGISDISPLAGLTNLTELSLIDNRISNISPLSQLTSLTWLVLTGNQISNISVLAGLTNLTELYLSRNQISNISVLEGLTSLTELFLIDNQISDIGPLAKLTNLTVLSLYNNPIHDISSLKGLTELIQLDLNNTEINDLTPIGGLDKLIHLYASTTQLDNIQAVSELTNLRLLGITSTKVSDLSPIKQLNHLDALFFSGTPVDTLEPLKDLKKLRVLSFQNTNIDTLEPLKELTGLQTLKIQNTPINSLEPLKGLGNLKKLYIEGCENITTEQIDKLQKALPDCEIPAALIKESFIINWQWRLFFNPKVPGLSKTKVMRFGKDGVILEGQNNNESSWRLRYGYFEMLDSEGKVHSRFYHSFEENRFCHTNDPDTGSIRKHSIRDQYMVPIKFLS